jgi:hypothetical protein
MSEALKPNFFQEFSSIAALKDSDIKEHDPDAEALAIIKTSTGWSIVRDLIDRTMSDLDQMLLTKMANGSQLNEIGQLAITNQLIKDVLNRIKSRVEDTPDK